MGAVSKMIGSSSDIATVSAVIVARNKVSTVAGGQIRLEQCNGVMHFKHSTCCVPHIELDVV